jgi:hypothetical protein
MTTFYRRLAEQRHPRRFRVIAGHPVAEPPARNPWADADSDERLLAAAFADRVVLVACLVIGVLLLAELAAPDLLAWISGHPVVMVAR